MATDTLSTSKNEPDGPDALRLDADSLTTRAFPCRETEYRVVLDSKAHQAIMTHAESSPNVELCGVLVGDLFRDDDGPFLVVTDIIQGRSTKEGDHSVTFTHSTWEKIHREMDEKHAGSRIVGWYHTHPGFGVFLSEVDLFAHRNFFNAAWQIALVVDPKAGQTGLFFWRNGQVVRARRFWIGEDVRWESDRPAVSVAPGTLHKGRSEGAAAPRSEPPSDSGDSWLSNTVLMTALGILVVILAYLNLSADLRNAQLSSEVVTLRRQLGGEAASLARSLAFRLRDQLDRDGRITRAMRANFEEILRLDPENRPAYETFLPELGPPRSEPLKTPSKAGSSVGAESSSTKPKKAS